jgi:WD40 repeat protein/DNA-binding SARP family transcriptional activator
VVGIAVLGPLSVEGDGAVLGPRDRVVLAALSVRPGEVVSAERLADALWAEGPPASWPKVVQGCVVRLRKSLGAPAIETTRQGYRLALPVDEVDARRFERLVDRARELLTLGEPERAAHVIGEALALWRGRALVELEGWEPGRIEAERLEELRRDAEELGLDAALRAGRHRDVLAEAHARVGEAPLRERRWALLALAQYQAGRQGEALRTLHRARTMLTSELGLDPGPDLVALEAAILRQDPSLVAAVALPEPSVTCPYLGLVPYDVGDADGFFGRDTDVAACLRRLGAVGVLAVVGPSGSGKSSLVRAGVAAALERDGRRVVVVTPGSRPGDALTVLPGSGPAPVLVVDQCEEAVTLCDDAGEQARFFAALAAHVERGPLVVALRADRLGELSSHPGFARLIEPGLYLLGAMSDADLRAAIEGPARQASLLLEPGLVELLVREVEGEPGALPLLSHALRTTWARREGRTLTVAGYRETGGIRGAVAQSAEKLYHQLPPHQQPLLHHLLLRLVTPSPEGDPVRSRVPRRVVATDPAHEHLIELLVAARLVTSDDGVVELAHEALAWAWPRLRDWLDEDIEGQRILRHVTVAADTWDAMGRPDSELYRGARLAQSLDWRRRAHPDLTSTERAFLDAGQTLADSERRAAEDRARHQVRVNRRLRALLAVVGVLLVAALIAGIAPVRQRDRAQDEREVATARELAAAANANLDVDPERSILLALAAVDQTRSAEGSVLPEAQEALHAAVTRSLIELRVPGVGGSLDWSPDGTIFVTEGPEDTGNVDVRDARTGESLRSWHGHELDVNDVAFNHDGTMLATTGEDGAARVWDAATGRELHAIEASTGEVWGPSFSPDGSMFAAAWQDDGVVRVLDLATGRVVREIRAIAAPRDTSFSPAGTRLAVASVVDPVPIVVDTASGEEVFRLEGHRSGAVWDVDWSPDRASIATAGDDAAARIFDAGTGRPRFALLGHFITVQEVDWGPESESLVTASQDGTAKVWTLFEGGGRELMILSAQDTRGGIDGVAFSPDGSRVITGNRDISATRIWDVGRNGHAEVTNLVMTQPGFPAATYTPDGRYLLSTGPEGSVTVWDAQTFTYVRSLGAAPSSGTPDWVTSDSVPPAASPANARYVNVSHDGRLVAAAGPHGVRVWDIQSGQEVFALPAQPRADFSPSADWSPTSDLLAVTGRETVPGAEGERGLVTIVDRTGREVTVLREEPGVGAGLPVFSPDGDRLVTSRVPLGRDDATVDAQVAIWDWKTGTVQRTLGEGLGRAFASPVGDLIAATRSTQDVIEVWDAATGERVATLSGHTGAVRTAAFSPDGSRLASTGNDGTVRIWDPRTGEQMLVLRGHIAAVSSVAFSPDGSQLVSAGAEGIARVWALDLDELVEIAESELTRTFTAQECRQYLHMPTCPSA